MAVSRSNIDGAARKKRIIGICIGLIVAVIVLITFLIKSSFSMIDNHSRVAENSELTYYLEISYDGKDKNLTMSSDSATAEVRSDIIHIEDKLPDGLIFKGFVPSSDGKTIGAVKRSDSSTACGGYVIDGMNGLYYDEATRTVSFKIKNLQAGCKLQVGIITQTPSLGNKTRMDFYNTAFGRENAFTTKSNTLHVYMGKEDVTLHSVTYIYEGEVPEGAPELPKKVDGGLDELSYYTSGTEVGVLADINVAGYTFSGWSTTDVTVTDGKFTMPDKDVVLKGSFTKKQTYAVSYKIDGETPTGYLPPKTKEYGSSEDVIIDSLKTGDIISGYRFLGWETTDVVVSEEGTFEMPEKNVTLTGRFEKVTYTVTYEFQGTVLPPNASSLIPEVKSYEPGATVTTAQDPVATGYKFLGWYKPETFTMPEENIVIYGEWMEIKGSFTPAIVKTIMGAAKEYYSAGEKITFEITVTNPESYPINDVMIQEENPDSTFIAGEGYTVLNNHHVKIDTIPGGATVKVYAEYIAGNHVFTTVTNAVSLVGAIADDGYYLNTDKEYRSTTTFKIANISLTIVKQNIEHETLNGAEFTLYEDSACTKIVSSGMVFESLKPNKTYYLKETRVPTGYVKLKDTLAITIDDTGQMTVPNYTVTGENGNYSITIYNKKINILPDTGGIGTIPFVIGGLVLMLGSAGGYIYFTKKKDRGDKNDKENTK